MRRLCREPDCGRVAKQRGLCARCYADRARAGTLPAAESYSGPTLPNLAALGLTYRKLDYWTSIGHIRADETHPGSGARRTWPEHELRVATRIGRLTDAGIRLDRAAHLARCPGTDLELAPGITVRVDDLPDPLEEAS